MSDMFADADGVIHFGTPLAPPGIYGSSKLVLERLAPDFCQWYDMSIAGFRLTRIFYNNDFGRNKRRRRCLRAEGATAAALLALGNRRGIILGSVRHRSHGVL